MAVVLYKTRFSIYELGVSLRLLLTHELTTPIDMDEGFTM